MKKKEEKKITEWSGSRNVDGYKKHVDVITKLFYWFVRWYVILKMAACKQHCLAHTPKYQIPNYHNDGNNVLADSKMRKISFENEITFDYLVIFVFSIYFASFDQMVDGPGILNEIRHNIFIGGLFKFCAHEHFVIGTGFFFFRKMKPITHTYTHAHKLLLYNGFLFSSSLNLSLDLSLWHLEYFLSPLFFCPSLSSKLFY